MRKLSPLLALVLLGVCQNSYAMYLFVFQNNSNKNVYIYGKVPGNWVNVPKYPLLLFPGEVFVDGGSKDPAGLVLDSIVTAKALKKSPNVEKMHNVGLPASGKKNAFSACNKDDVKHYLQIVVDAPGGAYRVYRLYDCGWKINVLVRTKDKKWKHYNEELEFRAGWKYWNMVIGKKGDLQLCKDMAKGGCTWESHGPSPSRASVTGEASKLRY
jgi:hypothetical protein